MPARASNRYSQQSRYSDTVPLRRHSPAIKPRSTSQNSGPRQNANSYHGRYRVPGRWYTLFIRAFNDFFTSNYRQSNPNPIDGFQTLYVRVIRYMLSCTLYNDNVGLQFRARSSWKTRCTLVFFFVWSFSAVRVGKTFTNTWILIIWDIAVSI